MHEAVQLEQLTPARDRRRNPRFICGGEAKVVSLPLEGSFFPGAVRDLSLGGCCIEMASPLPCGARAEVLMRVQESCFRALGQVRAVRNPSGICMEFLRLSARGQNILAELIAELARLREIVERLKDARNEISPELLHSLLWRPNLAPSTMLGTSLTVGTVLSPQPAERTSLILPGTTPSREEELETIPLDLFI